MKLKFLVLSLALIAIGGCVSEEELPDDGRARSIPGKAVESGKTMELESNMNQIRQFVAMYRQENDGRNPTLEELKAMKGLPASLWVNPVDGTPILYDQASGAVYPSGGKAPGKVSRASQMNNSETGSPAPPSAALPQTQPADPDAPTSSTAPAVPAIPSVPAQ